MTGRERIPIPRIIDKLDRHFAKNDLSGAGELLTFWQKEAVALGDRSGELSIVSELLGYYRKTWEEEKALAAVARALALVDELELGESVSGATVLLNAATTLKAFGRAREAMPLYEKTHTVYGLNLSPDDPRFGGLYNNMALSLVDLGRFEDAKTSYEKALAVMAKAPAGAPDCAVTYVNMAHLFSAWGKEHEEEAKDALAAAKKTLEGVPASGRDSYYAFVLTKCAPSFADFGFADYAETLKKRAEKIYAGA